MLRTNCSVTSAAGALCCFDPYLLQYSIKSILPILREMK
uniref:Uncharacterized protein n=1 Tax=Nelumbo nucifera TaxID=4432 RepID=A0A822XV78_NELNU|nr:TPA_asm: hypothetical protein HUJ06_024309 [Nelumbo nucifera]